MIELGKVFQDAADARLGGRTLGRAGDVVTRVRRRRAVRAVGTGAVAVVLTGTVALGAAQGGWRTPPPATTAAPTPTEPTETWPAVHVAEGEAFVCGAQVPTIVDPAGDAEVRLEARVAHEPELDLETGDPVRGDLTADDFRSFAGATMTQGDHWVVEADVVNAGDQALRWGLFGHAEPRVHIVHDGVVVGAGSTQVIDALTAPGVRPLDLAPGEAYTVVQWWRWTACPVPSSGEIVPLDGGAYEMYVTQAVGTRPPVEEDGWEIDPLITLVAGPFDVTLEPGRVPSQVDLLNEHMRATTPPGAEDVWLSFAGLGSAFGDEEVLLPLGWEIPADLPPRSLVTWDPQFCSGSDEPGRWVEVWNDGRPMSGYDAPYFTVEVRDGRVVRIDMFSLTTDEFARVGSSLDEVRAIYPDAVRVDTPAEWGVQAWAVRRDGVSLVFEVGEYLGTADSVVAMSLTTDYDRPADRDVCA